MYLWKVWKPFQVGEEYVVTNQKEVGEVVKVLNDNDYVEPEKISFVTTVFAPKGEVLDNELAEWKEMFHLLKSDHEKLENFQTEEWKEKYRKLVGEDA